MKTAFVLFASLVILHIGCLGKEQQIADKKTLQLGKNASFSVLIGSDNEFLGIGAINIEGILLSSEKKPLQFEIVGRMDKYNCWEKPDVIDYKTIRFNGTEQGPQGAVIVKVDLIDKNDDIDNLEIEFRPVSEKFYESPAIGLSYRFRWSSPKRYAHQIRETSAWTFGESVTGLRMLSQNSGYGRNSVDFIIRDNMPVGGYKLTGAIETADIARILDAKTDNPITFGYIPHKEARETRQGDGDYLTFFSRQEKNISFLRYAATPSMSYWQYERLPGQKDIKFEEWYCAPLSRNITTEPIIVQVLRKAGVNAWIDAKEIVMEKLRASVDFPRMDPWPWVAYSQKAIDDPSTLRYWVDYRTALKTMTDCGIKEFWWYGPWQSNWSEEDRMTEQEKARHDIYGHSVWDYDWAYKKFDIQGIRTFTQKALEHNITLSIWATQTMSQCSPFIYAHPNWALRRPDGSLFNYVYTDLVGMNHHSPWSDFYVDRMTARSREIPFESIWMDSFFFSGDLIDWMDVDLYPNFIASLATMKKLFAAGFTRIYTEHHGPFVLSSATGYLDKKEMLAGKKLHLLYNLALVDHLGTPSKLEATPELYFQLLAYKCCPQPYIKQYVDFPDFAQKATYANKAYQKAIGLMHKCVVLEDGRGTLYYDTSRKNGILFSFKDFEFTPPKPLDTCREILSNEKTSLIGGSIKVKPFQVYHLKFAR